MLEDSEVNDPSVGYRYPLTPFPKASPFSPCSNTAAGKAIVAPLTLCDALWLLTKPHQRRLPPVPLTRRRSNVAPTSLPAPTATSRALAVPLCTLHALP